MWNDGLDESQAEMNNLWYADDTTLTAESDEELKSLLIKLKEESEKAGLKLNIPKTKIMASGPIISWSYSNLFSLVPKSLLMVTAAMKLKHVCFLEEKQWQT